MIGNYNSWRRNPQTFKTNKRVTINFLTVTPSHMPELELSRGRCHYCQNQGRAIVKCNTCGVFLSLGGFCIWPKLFLQTSFTRSLNLFTLLDNTNPALCALFLVHYFVKDEKLTIHLVSFTLSGSYYNEFFAIKKMSAL